MASIDTNNGNDGKKGKPQRKVLRVDFTPMVDMNMLLITFFMFCTTLSIPQVMDIAMPADTTEKDKITGSKSVTVILGENDKMYYYEGLPDYEDYTSLKETTSLGVREMLLTRNAANFNKISELKRMRHKKEISDEQFKQQLKDVYRSKDGINVLIKPTKDSNYKNLVDILDEMQICGVDKYAIVEMEDADKFLMENLISKGSLTAMADF
ncbi:biopolymer transporter ExbD [Dysgonomonas sp. 511]|uniref:ExbD/TolR family protein n=1 Tax=Dysgonomonas sp. 511 TaxID=2302930 RepID=UPI0013D0E20F|nr:biopolymer transporter ExbD [Dysgonomonas sp. 511]NDV78552.1 biopolymer transporter ExbD [Dysgonomonas sp. 511]